MKERMTYWRRKGGKFVAEGKSKGKTIFLFTVPDVEEVVMSSLFKGEKQAKIMAKIQSLDYRERKNQKTAPKVRIINNMSSSELDEELDDIKESIEQGVKPKKKPYEEFL